MTGSTSTTTTSSSNSSAQVEFETNSSLDCGHRVHLRALLHQEQDLAYRRYDYLSSEWQLGLWKDEVAKELSIHELRQSPCAVSHDPFGDDDMSGATSPSSLTPLPPGSPPRALPRSTCSLTTMGGEVPQGPSEICVRWREKIIEWKYQVVDRFDLDREIVSISTFYMDQYLSRHYVDEELFQLAAMASIYLAIKIHSSKKVTIHSIASTGNGLITTKHIEAMELSIMKCLNWHLFPPTVVGYIENFFPLISRSCDNKKSNKHKVADSLEFSRFLAELSVCAYPFVSAKPSSIAVAAILYSLEYFGLDPAVHKSFQQLANDVLALEDACNDPEVLDCGRLLRKVYALAMPECDVP